MKLSVYYQNVQGLKTKVNRFKSNVLSNDYDVILLCETWLTDEYGDSELFDSRYAVYRQDRDRFLVGKKDGGGCLIAVKSDYFSQRIYDFELGKEDIWISLDQCNGEKIYFNVRYIDCKSTFDVYDMHFSKINDIINVFKPEGKFLLFGDYNLSNTISWSAEPDGSCSAENAIGPISESLVDLLSLTNLNQFNSKRNVNDRTLDLLLSNVDPDKMIIDNENEVITRMDRHHPPIALLLDVSPLKFIAENRPPKLNFFRADYETINKSIAGIDWVNRLDGLGTNEALSMFYELLTPLIETVPRIRNSVKNFPCWYTSDLIKALKLKVRARRKFLRTKNPIHQKCFANLRKEFKALKKLCEEAYVCDIEDKITTNTKAFFSYTKSLRKTNSIPNRVQLCDEFADDCDSVCDLFAKYFASVFQQDSYCDFVMNQFAPDIHISAVSANEVKAILDRLDQFKVSSPDNIPAIFFRKLSSTICVPLSILYNKSIREGIFPSAWKISNVTPVYKSGKRSDVCNYRPISILAAASKVFERIVFNKVFDHVKTFITPVQHGFITARSTLTNLLEYATHITDSMIDGGQLDTIFTDFSKAFDQVSHRLLLLKLQNFGIKSNVLSWFTSYLSGRTQHVVIGGSKSRAITPTSGIPQGSILGPLLFLLFINDLPEIFSSSSSLFADDNKIFRKIGNLADCSSLQSDISSFSTWCDSNLLKLNPEKCSSLTITCKPEPTNFQYSINGSPIEIKSLKKDLGVTFDRKQSFKAHISEITRKSYQLIGFIFRSTQHFRRPASLIKLYTTYVRSKLEYCSPIWNPYYEKYVEQIEKVQRKFTRMLYYKFKWIKPDYATRLKQLKMQSLETRRLQLDEMLLYKIIHEKVDTSLTSRICIHQPQRTTRQQSHRTFYLPTPSSNIQLNSPIHRIQNNHDIYFRSCDIMNTTYSQYKNIVKTFHQF